MSLERTNIILPQGLCMSWLCLHLPMAGFFSSFITLLKIESLRCHLTPLICSLHFFLFSVCITPLNDLMCGLSLPIRMEVPGELGS